MLLIKQIIYIYEGLFDIKNSFVCFASFSIIVLGLDYVFTFRKYCANWLKGPNSSEPTKSVSIDCLPCTTFASK